jgi:hypothetical protein
VSQICDGGMFTGNEFRWAWVLFTIVRIAFWVGVAWVLHYKKYYVAL